MIWNMKKLFILVFLLLSFFLAHSSVEALECEDKQGQEKINCLQNKVNELKGQKRTLSSQIAVMDSQIRLTEARIFAAKQEISELTLDIETADKKIDSLESSLDNLIKVLINRMVATYEIGRAQPFEILLSSNNVTSFFSRLNYLRIAQQHDKQLIYLTQQAKSDYANQKDIFENKKKRVEALKTQLENYTLQLEQNKNAKQALLTETQGNEATYQALLQQAQAELAVTFGGGTEAFMRDVKEGDSIGTIIYGQSGCSTGSHLHFEVHKNDKVDDPNNYLSSTSYSYPYGESDSGSINPRGPWPWPINQPIYITQGYGMTPYAQSGAYSGSPHYGIDMYNNSLVVKAVASGQLYRGSYQCKNGTLYYAKVKQSDGINVLYMHIYPN